MLLFICKYNSEHAEFNFFYLKHVAKQKHNSYHYVKINCEFTPNSRGLWHQFGVNPCCLTRLYTAVCSNSYFDLDFPKVYNELFEN